MDLPPTGHDPVLLDEVMDCLRPGAGQTFIDCTLGRGGHAEAIGKRLGKEGLLIGLDVDPRNLEFADRRLANLTCRRRLFHANFAEIDEVLSQVEVEQVDGLLADLGVSTNQLFDETYGLSFAASMPLDMRLDPRIKRTAADWVNRLTGTELADLLHGLAQEKASRRIAKKIVAERKRVPITTTDQLAGIVRSAIGRSSEKIDPATRTFLALRMAVNDEMNNLRVLIERGPALLKPGGRMAVISFQSTEDRLVKQGFRIWQERGEVKILTKKPIEADDAEVATNPRSRSAKMRVIEKRELPVASC